MGRQIKIKIPHESVRIENQKEGEQEEGIKETWADVGGKKAGGAMQQEQEDTIDVGGWRGSQKRTMKKTKVVVEEGGHENKVRKERKEGEGGLDRTGKVCFYQKGKGVES